MVENKRTLTTQDEYIHGFILTTQWRDTPRGIVLDIWLATDDQPVCVTIPAHHGVCFFLLDDLFAVQRILQKFPSAYTKAVDLKHYSGKKVQALYYLNQQQLRQIKEHCLKENIRLWEDNIKPADRFLMERFITTGVSLPHAEKAQKQKAFYSITTETLSSSRYQPSFKVMSIDIETSMDARELYSIAAFSDQYAMVFVVGECAGFDDTTTVIACRDQRDCLQQFIHWFHEADPDIIIGWHVVQFDFWVLQKIADRLRVPLTLGRSKQRLFWREDSQNERRRYVSMAGRVVLDGIELLRTAFYTFDRYSLQFVASKVLGKDKLIQSDDRGQAITDLFHRNKPALAAYNLQDCQLVWEIFEALELLDFAIARARLTGLPLDRSGGSVASFDYAYLPRLHRAGFVAPNLGELESTVVSPGGHVMRSEPGLYQHVLVLDFKSLYPSIIRTFNIDPFAFWYAQHEKLSRNEVIEGFNGAFFSREKSILPGIIDELWQARDQAKRENNKALSQAIKIIMNSFYGVLGSQGCRFYDPSVCSSITLRGHDILQRSRDWIEAQGYQVIYGDTDSVFVWLGDDGDDSQAQHLGEQLQSGLNQWWQQYLRETFDLNSALEIEFETHYAHFLMPTIRGSAEGSKKRYAGVIKTQTADGHLQDKLVFKGLENVRTDWTALAKQFQERLYAYIFAKEPYDDFIRETVNALWAGELDGDLIYQKKLRRELNQYIKSTPPHIKAARQYERLSQQRLHRGDRIEYVLTVNGPEPVDYRQSAIDYQHYIDKQLKPIADSILNFVDRDFDTIISVQMSLL